MGEHDDEALSEPLDLDVEERAALRSNGVIGDLRAEETNRPCR